MHWQPHFMLDQSHNAFYLFSQSSSLKHSLINFAQSHRTNSNVPNPHVSLISPSYPLQIPGWPSLKLCLEFQNGPSVIDWRHLDFGIIFVIAHRTGLHVCFITP